MLIAGWAILVKPVYALLYVLLLSLYAFLTIKKRHYLKLLFILLFFVLPLCQSVFSKYHYDNYQLKSGLGWNLWNRVIHDDGLMPSDSRNLDQLLHYAQITDKNELMHAYWWDVTVKLSSQGFKERFIQDLCLKVVIDGIKEHPVLFIKNTFIKSFKYYNAGMETRAWETDLNDYYNNLRQLSLERHNKPLAGALLLQRQINISTFSSKIITVNQKFALLQSFYNNMIHNSIVSILFLLAPVFVVINILIEKDTDLMKYTPQVVIWLTGFSILFGSTLSETAVDRYVLPVVIFVMFSIAQTIEILIRILSRYKILGTGIAIRGSEIK